MKYDFEVDPTVLIISVFRRVDPSRPLIVFSGRQAIDINVIRDMSVMVFIQRLTPCCDQRPEGHDVSGNLSLQHKTARGTQMVRCIKSYILNTEI